MRDYIIFAIVFGALPFVLKRPYIGILLWCWVSYMNPHRFAFGTAYDFPFAALIAAATLAGFFLSKEPKSIPWTSLTVMWVVFVLWMSFTTLFALVPADAYLEWLRTGKIQIMAFLTVAAIGTRERLNSFIWIIVISIGFFGVKGGVFSLLTGGEFMIWGPPDSLISGNTSIALALVMTLPLMRYLQLNTHNRWLRYGLVVAMLLSSLSILASYSRGAFLAITAMAIFLVMKSRKRVTILLLTVLVVPLMLSFMPDKWFERIQTIETYEQDRSALGRINAWWFAFNVAKERPVVGGGYDVFVPELFQKYAPDPDFHQDAHSIYFEVLGEHGFVGLALFLILGLTAFRAGGRIIRSTRDQPGLEWASDLAAMTQASIIGYAVGGAFLGLAYFDLYYHLIAILLITHLLVERALQERAASLDQVETRDPEPGLANRT